MPIYNIKLNFRCLFFTLDQKKLYGTHSQLLFRNKNSNEINKSEYDWSFEVMRIFIDIFFLLSLKHENHSLAELTSFVEMMTRN